MAATEGAQTGVRKHRGRSATPEGRSERAAAARRGISTSSAAGAALVSEDKHLTEQQRLFVKLWAQGETIGTATIRAGYNDHSYGYRLARMPNVLRLYSEEKAAYERDSAMTRAQVVEGFKDGIEMARMLGEPSSMIAGWREIGRLCGYYEPVKVKHEISVEGKVLIERMETMSDDELMRVIEQRASAMQQQLTLPGDNNDDDDEAGNGGGA